MSPLSFVWGTIAGACVVLAVVHLLIARRVNSPRVYLLFAGAALAAAGAIAMEIVLYSAGSRDAYRHALKVMTGLQITWTVLLIWFFVEYTGIQRRLTAWLLTAVYAAAALTDLLSSAGVMHGSIDALGSIILPWGETITHGSGSRHPLFIVFALSVILLPAFFVDLVVHLRRTGQRRRLGRVGIAFALLVAGELYDFLLDASVVKTHYVFAPAVLGILGVVAADLATDVVRVTSLSRELVFQQDRWDAFLENIEVLVLGIDARGAVDFVNPYFQALTGFGPEDWIRRPAADLVAPRDSDTFDAWLHDVNSSASDSACTEWAVRCASGRERRLAWSTVRRSTPDGMHILAIGVDVTERLDAQHRLEVALAEVTRLRDELERENIDLKEQFLAAHDFNEIIGDSDALRYALHKVQQVADTDITVLIEGETGVGKELIARAIHARSPRHDKPLVGVNCSALPSELVESELFGHEKGSFTGAVQTRRGRFELADGGTIFFDEIGDFPLSLQPKLLRALQEGEVQRIGSDQVRKVDVRIIAATNRVLIDEVRAGRFREDLYYRLSVFPLTVPPLRQRRDDIPLLVQHFVRLHAAKQEKVIEAIPPPVMDTLVRYPWPGNIRELQNVVERAVLASQGPLLKLSEPLGERPRSLEIAPAAEEQTLESVEREHILRVLERCNGQVAGPEGAARVLGMNASTLRSRMKKLGIRATARV